MSQPPQPWHPPEQQHAHPPDGYPPAGYPPPDTNGQQRWSEPRRRLHPLSPLLHGFKFLAVIIAAISIQGAAQLGLLGFIGTLMMVMVLATAYSAITWLVTGYHVIGRELRIYDGLLVRRTRAIPLERLQTVEVVRPLLARIFGLAELRLEVVGGGKTEAPLAFLTVSDAAMLRERLLAIAGRIGAPAAAEQPAETATTGAAAVAGAVAAAPEAEPASATGEPVAATAEGPALPPARPAAPAETHLHSVVNRDVLISQLRTPPVLFLPLAIAAVVTQYAFGAGAWSLVVMGSMLVAVIGVIQQPVRRMLANSNFRLAMQESTSDQRHHGLRVRHGLSETRSQTVPLHRVQGVAVTWPLLWRTKHWLRARMPVAGYAAPDQGITASDQLLPVGDFPTARRLTGVVLPGVDLAELPLAKAPRRARWVAPVRAPILACGLTDQVFAVRDGRVTRELVVVPYVRIQSVRLTQGPLQRQLGLATVHADTAGSLAASAYHRDLSEARYLAAELTARSRQARDAELATGAASPAVGGEATTS